MAIHPDKIGVLFESLDELVYTVGHCINYKKTSHIIFPKNNTGGILGYPATMLMFSIFDCIGSYYEDDNTFNISIDGKEKLIKNTTQHIFILNSKYFKLNLTELDLNNIYKNVRCTLIHNSIMPEGYHLQIGQKEQSPIRIGINENGNKIYFINVRPLFLLTKSAVEMFKKDIKDKLVEIEKSKNHEAISKRDKKTVVNFDLNSGDIYVKMKEWIV